MANFLDFFDTSVSTYDVKQNLVRYTAAYGTDANSLPEGSIVNCPGVTNGPTIGNFTIKTYASGTGTDLIQEAITLDNLMWKRFYTSSTWSNWVIISGSQTAVRQTVMSGNLDSSNNPNIIVSGVGLIPKLLATAYPCTMSFASGFGGNGAVDYVGQITSDTNFPSIPVNQTSFLYTDRNPSTGQLTLGATTTPPQYLMTGAAKQYASLLHAESIGPVVDEYGGTWVNNAVTLDTTNKKFGGGSFAFNGTTSYLYNTQMGYLNDLGSFTSECFVRFGTLPTTGIMQNVFSLGLTPTNGGAILQLYNNAGTTKLTLYLSSTGTTWDIAGGAVGSKSSWTAGQFYHIALSFDGSAYRVYVDGALDQIILSGVRVINNTSTYGTVLGAYWNGTTFVNYLNGNMDEFNCVPYAKYTSDSFTVPISALSVDSSYDVFNIQQYTMRKVGLNSGAIQRVYQGESTGRIYSSLLHCEALPIADDYTANNWRYNSGVTLDTTNKKFGGASLAFNGSSYAINPNMKNLGDLNTWTVEAFTRFTLPAAGTNATVASCVSFLGISTFLFGLNNTSGTYKSILSLSSNGSSNDIASTTLGTKTSWVAGTWYHFALVFDGSSYKLYIDGVLDQTISSSMKIFSGASNLGILLGSTVTSTFVPNNILTGNIDEFRVSAQARYTGAFTPPTIPFVADEINGTVVSPVSYAFNGQTRTNEKSNPLVSLGYGTVRQDIKASRVIGTTYYNTSGRPMHLYIAASSSAAGYGNVTVGGVTMSLSFSGSAGNTSCGSFIVKPGESYVLNTTAISSLQCWVEHY